MKSAYSLCSNREEISYEEREDIHFFSGVRSIIYKLTKGDTPEDVYKRQVQARGAESYIPQVFQ